MKLKRVLNAVGTILICLGATQLLPALVAVLANEDQKKSFLISGGLACGAGIVLRTFTRTRSPLQKREGFAIVAFAWLVAALFGAIPFYLSGVTPDLIDAVFESASGFTTTGSTVLQNLDNQPQSILFWRALEQWLGGMGIVVFAVAILPELGAGGMQLFQAESPGPRTEKFTPHIQETAQILWKTYFGLTLLLCLLLWMEGMSFFEAICHSFSTVSTGGFSTRDHSLADFASPAIQWTVIAFMFLSGLNFSLHHKILLGSLTAHFRSEEFRFFSLLIVIAVILIVLFGGIDAPLREKIRQVTFQVVSIATTTGFVSADYELWRPLAQLILLTLMIIGGCAGSTAGGLKVMRVDVLLKHAQSIITKITHRKKIITLHYDRANLRFDVLTGIQGLAVVFFITLLAGTLGLAACGLDFVSSGAAALACLSNVGPGIGSIGPTDNFAAIAAPGKLILVFCMIAGRLELLSLYVLLIPSFWKKF